VVVCRAAETSGQLVDRLHELGADVVAFPLLAVAPPIDGGAGLDAELARLDSYDWMVLTSTNAVDAVAVRCPDGLPPGVRVAVVGPATASAARRRGWTVAFEPSEATAAVVADELPVPTGARVLAPLAEQAAATLVDGLGARGAVVARVDAYRTITPAHPPDLVARAAGADAVLLSSPSIAERFAGLAGTAVPCVVVIGPSTAAAATRLGFTVSAVADPHTEAGLIAALVNTITP
jgi:uroporphyrinogen-III synthase